MNFTNKILIYDSSKVYLKFIKLKLINFEVVSFLEYNDYKLINAKDFVFVFFIVNKHIELLDLFCLQIRNTPIIITSPLIDINAKIKYDDAMIYFDLQTSKNDLLDFIKLKCKTLQAEETVDA